MGDRSVANFAETPHHVVHRRNDRSPCFFSDEDYLVYLDCLKEAAERHGCAVHAYALMPDHVQLLVSLDSETRLEQFMRGLGAHYVEYVNYTYRRNGEFWQEEPNATAIGNERDLLACYQAIEAAPVLARIVPGPADYRWSSHRHHACGGEDAIVRDHPWYLGLGTTQLARQLAYNELFRESTTDGPAPDRIRTASGRNRTLGAGWLEDGIKRSVRGLAWQAMYMRRRRAVRVPPLEGSAPALENYTDISRARARGARRLASK
jgi:putative transposase